MSLRSTLPLVFALTGCAVLFPKTSGTIATDGRELGEHEGHAWCDNQNLGDGSAVLHITISSGSRSSLHASVHVYPDAQTRGIDVHLPWSHVVFKPNDCSLFEAHVERTPLSEIDDTPAGNSGRLRVKCKLPDATDTFEADVTFRGC